MFLYQIAIDFKIDNWYWKIGF